MYVPSYAMFRPNGLLGSVDGAGIEGPVKAPVFGTAVLREAVATPVQDPERTLLFPADDKGLVDFVLLAFFLFGPNLEGLFFTTILVLLGCGLAMRAGAQNAANAVFEGQRIVGIVFDPPVQPLDARWQLTADGAYYPYDGTIRPVQGCVESNAQARDGGSVDKGC